MLDEAMREEKGEGVQNVEEELPSIDLTLDAYIPNGYIPSEKLRIEAYKKISRIRCEDDEWEIVDEFCDRFGNPPTSVMNLMKVALLRPTLQECRIKKVNQNEDRIYIYTSPLDRRACEALTALWRGKLSFCSATSPYLIFKPEKKKILEEFTTLLGEYKNILEKISE
jgi:transcription-repair coupling factor (superfamily II helicase)